MLPFLKRKDEGGIAGTIVKNRQPDEKQEEQGSYIKDCVKDLIEAISSKNVDLAEQSLRDIFQELEKQPHEEIDRAPDQI